VELEKCGLNDAEELASLGRETYFESFHAMNKPETMSLYLDKAFGTDRIKEELRNDSSEFFVCRIGFRAAAYLKVNFAPAQTDINDPESIEIERIYVKKSHWGQGIGTFLIDHSVELGENHDCRYAWLGVWEQNLPAISFYREMGFEVFNPVQPGVPGHLPQDIKNSFGEKFGFWGAIDQQDLLPNGSDEELEKDIMEKISILGKGGGYMISPAHIIQNDVSPERVLKFIDLCKKRGKY